jgi:hypothetical protein
MQARHRGSAHAHASAVGLTRFFATVFSLYQVHTIKMAIWADMKMEHT